MRLITFLLFLILHSLVHVPGCYSEGTIKVSFINPDPSGSLFWDRVTLFMQAVSRDLDIDLTVYHGEVGRFSVKELVKDITQSKNKPDYLITLAHLNTTPEILKLTQEAGIKVFFINTDISSEEKILLGSPRTTYKNWLGQMTPDDTKGGYDLAITLAREYNILHRSDLHLIAFSGSRDASASCSVIKGWNKRLPKHMISICSKYSFFTGVKKNHRA